MHNEHFILSNLARHPEYYDEVINLIEEEFHYQSENHFNIDFAPLVNPLNFENCLILIEKNSHKIVSHLAFTNRFMVKNDINLPVCFIGGIVTQREFRGKNLFRKLMNRVIAQNEKQIGLFFLWSDIESLYEKFNFHLAGGLFETGKKIITTDNIPDDLQKTNFSKLSEKEFNDIKWLYSHSIEKNFFTLKRNESHWAIIREMSSIDLFIKKDKTEKIITYLCQSKGRDLTGVIHEIGSTDLSKTIEQFRDFRLWLPEYYCDKNIENSLQFTAFIRIGSIKILAQFLLDISVQKLHLISHQNQNVEFNFNNLNYKVSEKEFLQYLLGPNPLSEFSEFKLSPYISGVDSI